MAARLIQKIYAGEITLEVEVGLCPYAWAREWPTHVRVEGQIDPQLLAQVVEYVEATKLWRWDPQQRKFYPIA
jgi:hypothetical protein